MGGLTSTSTASPTTITDPTGNIHQGEQGAGAGAAQGAAAGAAVGTQILPGWGTAIGAVIGGIVGFAAGAFADKGKMYERKARKWARVGKNREAAIDVRNAVDTFRQQRALQMSAIAAEAGGTQSSAPAGSISSLGSQYAFGLNFNQGQMYIASKVEKNLTKAGKAYNSSKAGFGYLNAATSIAGSFGGFGGGGSGSQGLTFGTNSASGIQMQNQAFSDINSQFGHINMSGSI